MRCVVPLVATFQRRQVSLFPDADVNDTISLRASSIVILLGTVQRRQYFSRMHAAVIDEEFIFSSFA